MRSNRRRHSKFTAVNRGIVAYVSLMILIVAGGAFVNLILRSRISSLNKDIQDLERKNNALLVDVNREQANWGKINTPEALDVALLRFGKKMKLPCGENIVSLMNVTREGGVDNSGYNSYASK